MKLINFTEFCSKFEWTLKSPKVNFKICQGNIEFVWDIYKIGATYVAANSVISMTKLK